MHEDIVARAIDWLIVTALFAGNAALALGAVPSAL